MLAVLEYTRHVESRRSPSERASWALSVNEIIWNVSEIFHLRFADAYRRIRERAKAPGFLYDGSW
jgi:hypothetical protein